MKSSPEPETPTVCGLPEALSVTERLPLLVPPAVGLKMTVIVQFAPAMSAPPQLFVCEKSPLTPIVVIVSEDWPELVRVTIWAALVVPTNWPPNDNLEGKTLALAGAAKSPNAPTPFVVPTYTLPLAIVGVMNLLPVPNWSRVPAWLLLLRLCAVEPVWGQADLIKPFGDPRNMG